MRLKKNSAQDPAVPVLGIQSKELKTNVLTRAGHVPSAHSSITNDSKRWKQPRCLSAGEWVNTVPSYTMGHYLIIKE